MCRRLGGETIGAMEQRLCRLQYEVGRVETCPGARCPFWESTSCVVDGVDVAGRSDLATWLLGIRGSLERARMRDDQREARRLFYRALNEGQGE
jgi:hypothetical protein